MANGNPFKKRCGDGYEEQKKMRDMEAESAMQKKMSLATHSLLAQQEVPQESEKAAIIPGTFGGEGVLGHESRQTDSAAYQDYNTQGTQGIAPD